MTEVVAFPDVEALCVSFLNGAFVARTDPARAHSAIPRQRPNRLVKVTRTGGSRINPGQDAPQVTFECWDSSEAAASALARIVRALIGSMDEYGSEVGGVVFLPDPDTNSPRYQFTAQLYTAGVPL